MRKNIFIIICLSFIAFGARAQTAGSLDQTANNAQGQYQPMNMGYAGFNSLGMTQAAWLDPLQNLGEGQTKPAYSKYYWNEDLVLPIRLRESMVTLINFPEWEMIESVQFGDSKSFSGEIVGPNTVLLWSKGNVGVDTNVIIFGRSGNKYVFYVKSEGVDTERLTNAIIDIEIPDANGSDNGSGGSQGGFSGSSSSGGFIGNSGSSGSINKATRRFQKKDWLNSVPFNPDQLKFDMEVYVPNPEDVVIAPERVWRDDVFTYIDLGEKALTMVQRPIVTQIVERSEMPVGFRTKGPNNRLIVVEGIGDFVLRNGKRIICLKIRRSDAKGIEYSATYEDDPAYGQEWDVPPPLPNNGSQGGAFVEELDYGSMGGGSQGAGFGNNQGYSNQNTAQGYQGYGDFINGSQGSGMGSQGGNVVGYAQEFYTSTPAIDETQMGSISVQLGTGDDISKMEDLWSELSTKYAETLNGYDPFFSVDAPADGEGKELFHLRITPISSIEEGDSLCSDLGRKGVFCSVVRTQ